jgi:GntR family transcriptional regulator
MTKHQFLVADIARFIRARSPGTAIPSERELAQRYGVSRMTLRTAINELVQDGLLTRRRGSGTYVAKPKITKQVYLTSFTEDMRSRGLEATTRVLSLTRGAAGARLGRRLHVSPSELVVTAGRLRLADGEPMAIEWLSVPDRLVPGLDSIDLDESFYRLLRERYGITIEAGHQTMEPTVTDEEESRLLEVPLHSPALSVERVTWRADGERIEYVRTLYRGDRYRFDVELVQPRVRASESVS